MALAGLKAWAAAHPGAGTLIAVNSGANLNFDPCVDILENWRNTIVTTRAYGSTADDVIKYTIPFVEGQRESGILTCVKHWPGDGTEERDQHLILGVNC